MNSRELNKDEAANLAILNDAGIESCLIFLTYTGLKKSILDATKPVRQMLHDEGVHTFDSQDQGTEAKILVDTVIFHSGKRSNTKTSLYRPKTKDGDPRLWPYELKRVAEPNDIFSIFIDSGNIFLVNISSINGADFHEGSELSRFLNDRKLSYNRVANELLFKLRELALTGPLEAVCKGDTAIGRTIETYLGIDINSSPDPDYKGIELKSGRSQSKTRDNLFAKVADWDISELKSSRRIVEEVGYEIPNEECRKLYCTVNTQKPNPQGLILELDQDLERLDELLFKSDRKSKVCVWRLSSLHEKLQQKHPETFWLKAKEVNLKGKTCFELETIKHTRRPSNLQFNRLLDSGEITMDHLIKLKYSNNKVNEKGPLFKIKPSAINELFLGIPQLYDLRG